MAALEGDAIVCRGVCKKFGSKKYADQALQNVSITVPKGTIYGLLGPSGCGKTTLLRCILGRLAVNEGTILVYDEPPQNKNNPNRPKIGYMPQDIALTEELTADETLRLFGKIANLTTKQIKERTAFLVKFLEMPFHKLEIRTLSGGQKRKVSFAVALIHEPDIIILDEPTVGVDPPLRKSIWKYLYTLAEKKNATIIVTTHYIEEANMAHNVGLMFDGAMVAEDKPSALIERHGCQTLEKVFLKLCLQSNSSQTVNTSNEGALECENIKKVDVMDDSKTLKLSNKEGTNIGGKTQSRTFYDFKFQQPNAHRIWALCLKDLWLIMRHPAFMIGIFVLPSVIMILFEITLGKPLHGLPLGIVNNDGMKLSNLYLQSIDHSLIKQIPYKSYDEAFKNAKNGNIWGILHLNSNFTKAITKRYLNMPLVDDTSLEDSLIVVSMDLTNKFVEIIINLELLRSYREFLQDIFHHWGLNTMLADLPINYKQRQVFGSIGSSLADFYYPSFILQLIFYLAMALTAVTLVVANHSGKLDRLYITGVDFLEIAFAQMLAHFFVMVVQTSVMFIVTFGILNMRCAGSYIVAFMLCVCQGFCGITLGVLISCICSQQTMTIVTNITVFLLSSLLNTFIYPLEGMHQALRVFCLLLPNTYSYETLRSILLRGSEISYTSTIAAFSIALTWSALFVIMAMIAFRFKS